MKAVRHRSTQIEIEAVCFDPDETEIVSRLRDWGCPVTEIEDSTDLEVDADEDGERYYTATAGDYIVKYEDGHFAVFDAENFAQDFVEV